MITIQEWKAMSGKEQTLWLEANCKVNWIGRSNSLVRGVGVNDSPYRIKPAIDGKQVSCPAYEAWRGMFKRAYSNKYHAKQPTYSGVTVCEDWHSFMSFRHWWLESQVDGWELDKDILYDDVVYSPETCIFVPSWLNLFTIDSGSSRGELPIGVDFHKQAGKYRAQCGHPLAGGRGRLSLGLFTTPEAAHLAWRTRKLELALELKPKMDEIDQRIYQRVCEIISNAK